MVQLDINMRFTVPYTIAHIKHASCTPQYARCVASHYKASGSGSMARLPYGRSIGSRLDWPVLTGARAPDLPLQQRVHIR